MGNWFLPQLSFHSSLVCSTMYQKLAREWTKEADQVDVRMANASVQDLDHHILRARCAAGDGGGNKGLVGARCPVAFGFSCHG